MSTQAPSPLNKQVGGTHYVSKIQHVSFCQQNRIPWCEAAAVKYLVRHRKKNGLEDLKKARHYVELLIHEDYDTLGREPRKSGVPVDLNPLKFRIKVNEFCLANGVGPDEGHVINRLLHHQVDHGRKTLASCLDRIDTLIRQYDPDAPEGSELL